MVDLPAPERPTSATISPGPTRRSMPARASTSGRVGYRKRTPSSVTAPSTRARRRPPPTAIRGSRASISKIHCVAPSPRTASPQNSEARRSPRATRSPYRTNEITAPEVRRPWRMRFAPAHRPNSAAASPTTNDTPPRAELENPAPGGLQGGRELLSVAGTGGRLLRERTNRADAAERLLGHDPGFRVRLLRAGREGLHAAAEDPRDDGDRRYREHQDQSERGRGVDEERHPERADQREPHGGAKRFTHD